MEDLHALCWLPIQENFGTVFQIELGGKLIEKRGLFQSASSRIAIESGEYAVSTEPTLVLPIADGSDLNIGMKVKIYANRYQILTKFIDEAKGVIVCDLAKTKN